MNIHPRNWKFIKLPSNQNKVDRDDPSTQIQFQQWIMPLLGILILYITSHCTEKSTYYINIHSIDRPLHKDSVLSFSFFIEDTSRIFTLKSVLYYSNEYPYSNLYLKRTIYQDTILEYSDTANYILFDAQGKMTGKGYYGEKKLENLIGRGPLRFRNIGYYTVKLQHLMRTDSLHGITKVGLMISNDN